MIRDVCLDDAERLAEIYNYYIVNTHVLFDEKEISVDFMREKIRQVTEQEMPWLIAENDIGEVLGFACAKQWREKNAYRHTAELTIYLDPVIHKKGLGTKMFNELFKELKSRSFNMVISLITLPNEASIALHEKFGMEKVAHFGEMGYKFDRWIDIGYWQGKLSEMDDHPEAVDPTNTQCSETSEAIDISDYPVAAKSAEDLCSA